MQNIKWEFGVVLIDVLEGITDVLVALLRLKSFTHS
jgi:hypothetical protein